MNATPDGASTIELDWFLPDVWFGRAIVWVERIRNRRARYCHGGIRTPTAYYEAVETGFRKLDAPPRPPDATRAMSVDSAALQHGSHYLEGQIGHRYSFITILADLASAVSGVHIICTIASEHVCSAQMAWALIYFGVLETDSPDAATPDSLAQMYGV
ncbi:MAG: hypothetical protein E6J20_19145 [Chloroflexi bacterium]|nr:MAG: hypothetical protein E6J20_19145 [Chloroflexota bacterium]